MSQSEGRMRPRTGGTSIALVAPVVVAVAARRVSASQQGAR
jgi:hypothetical protein